MWGGVWVRSFDCRCVYKEMEGGVKGIKAGCRLEHSEQQKTETTVRLDLIRLEAQKKAKVSSTQED